jgi:uncharacterized membrane protein YfcA
MILFYSEEIWLCLSALAAGVINSVAGGGTLLTFPALLAVVNGVVANATSTVALVPGSLAGAWGYRRELRQVSRWLLLLVWPSLIGGAIGALLLTRLKTEIFDALIPWLILVAALLFLLQPTLVHLSGLGKAQGPPRKGTLAALAGFQFLVSVYGGYFGAGIGILMLSSLGLMGISDIHQMNALKTILAACINGVAVVIFVIDREVVWWYALLMAASAIVGGYFGAHFARRMNRTFVRWLVSAIGFGLAAHFFYKQVAGGG